MHVSDRCVAVVDILGFRERVHSGKLVELAQLLDHLVTNAPRITTQWSISKPGSKGEISGRERMHKLHFSDTLFLWSDPFPKASERQRARLVGFLYGVAYVIDNALLSGLPLRAGVAYGPVFIHARKRIVIGQPIVDAYLAEGVQEWVGGAIHESYPRHAYNIYDVSYPVPVKSGAPFALARAIDWTMPARISDTRDKILLGFERALQSGIDSAPSDSVRRKYSNAAAFMGAVSDRWERSVIRKPISE